MSLTNQYQIHLTRARDNKDFGVWRTHAGRGVDSPETTIRDEFKGPRKQLGGPQTRSAITCSRTFYPDTDNGQADELEAGVGVDFFNVNKQKLDPDGHAVGSPKLDVCMLKSFKEADVDVGDDSPSADTYTIELSPEA